MTTATEQIEQAPLQDRDLLSRLSVYFDTLEQKLRQGQGWFIFNAAGGRSNRIARFISSRMVEDYPGVSSYMMPWRDFAISAYVQSAGLTHPEQAPDARERAIAKKITDQTWDRLLGSELVVLLGLKPSHWYEATLLDQAIDERYRQRLATILVTPDLPNQLESEYELVDPTKTFWDRLFSRMYETSLVAL